MLLPAVARPLAALASSYTSALSTNPLATNCVTSSALAVLSDGIAQRLDLSTSSWDWERSGWMALWGAVVAGLMLSQWYVFLKRCSPRASTSAMALAGKVAVNQLVMSPGLNGCFFCFAILTRESPRARYTADKGARMLKKLRTDLPRTMLRSNAFWICVQSINFRFIPELWTLLWVNSAFVVWTTYLALVGFRRVKLADE